MKILLLTEFFPKSDRGEITGGVEARCFYIAKYLRRSGHEVIVLADRTSGSRWSHLSFGTLATGIPYYLRMIARAIAVLGTEFDLVEGTNYTTYPFAWLLGLIRRKPVVFWYPDVFIGDWVKNVGPVGIIGELIERFVLKLPVSKYIAISLSTKTKLIKARVNTDKIELIYCGVDFTEIEPVTSRRYRKKYDIISVSRLVGYKRVIDTIKAVAVLKIKFPHIRLAVIGQGPEKRNLEREVKKLKLDSNVSFLGYISGHKEVLEKIAKSKILVLASVAEGFGIVVIESAALGVPTVLSDIPVLREVTGGGKGGLLFKPTDAIDLAAKIGALLTDRKFYKEKELGGKKLAQKYDWEEITRTTEHVYKKA